MQSEWLLGGCLIEGRGLGRTPIQKRHFAIGITKPDTPNVVVVAFGKDYPAEAHFGSSGFGSTQLLMEVIQVRLALKLVLTCTRPGCVCG
jgi:hypothetical protein